MGGISAKLRDILSKPIEELTRGESVVFFISEYCKCPEGSRVGKPLVLEDFQIDFILDIYDNPVVQMAILCIARKNGKTALIAALLLAHICGPLAELNSQIISGAMSRDQAALVHKLAVKMINLEPRLQAICHHVNTGKSIFGLAKNVEFRAISAEATTAHGLSPVVAILDEIGQIVGPTSPFVDAITTAQGAHERPLLIAISTSAASDSDLLSTWIDDAIRNSDPTVVCHVHKADEGTDLLDESQWKKANPALGTFRSVKDLRKQLEKANRMPANESSARNLLLNQRVSLQNLYVSASVWKRNSSPPDLDVFRNNPCAMGLDLSARNDLTAGVIASKDDDGIVHVYPFVYTPSENIEERARRDRAPYDAWVRDGYMYAIGGNAIEYDQVARHMQGALDEMDIEVSWICFDRWRINDFQRACEREGAFPWAEWVPIGQGFKDQSPSLENLTNHLLDGRIRHGNHPLLNLAASHAVSVNDPSGNTKIDKSKSSQRIDGLIAMHQAVYRVSDGDDGGAFDVATLIG